MDSWRAGSPCRTREQLGHSATRPPRAGRPTPSAPSAAPRTCPTPPLATSSIYPSRSLAASSRLATSTHARATGRWLVRLRSAHGLRCGSALAGDNPQQTRLLSVGKRRSESAGSVGTPLGPVFEGWDRIEFSTGQGGVGSDDLRHPRRGHHSPTPGGRRPELVYRCGRDVAAHPQRRHF